VDRLKVGIIFGGCSEEHPISIKSRERSQRTSTSKNMNRSILELPRVVNGSSATGPTRIGKTAIAARQCCHRTEALHGLLVLDQGNTKRSAWMWFPVLHGKLGEDGRLQGCSSSPASPTRVAISKVPHCVWTNPLRTRSSAAREIATRISGSSRRARM